MTFENHILKQANSEYAPICLFCYNRIDELRECVESLRKNYLVSESDLFIFSDGSQNEIDTLKVEEVRNYLREISGFNSVTIFESFTNKGLADSIISGVSQIIKEYDKVIVLEDDLVTTRNFLNFMNQALDFYESNKKIFTISGYTMDLPSLKNIAKNYYLGYRASSWGWATWQNRWENIDWDITDYTKFRWNIIEQIKFMRAGSDLPRMLKSQMKGKIDSWAVRWCYDQYQKDLLTIFPTRSKIMNIGFGVGATHTKKTNRYHVTLDEDNKKTFLFSNNIEIEKRLVKEFRKKFSILSRFIDKLI